ncbi:histidine kinase [Paenibacillus riograndensis]|uniref:histidine kinase n=1 Tax=Paenibacillus riograndensis TaxID=483937 RepID=A0A132TSU7_9BACL|nr:sensor histidine kinase [Paenibacillus riograndensis]KWX74415.1 histidine kinase [Paenibacillus riograndensis]
MSIVRKITLGYVILIFIPVVVFGYYYYSQIYGNLTNQFVQSRQKILEQAHANMKMDLTRIDSIQRMLQYNPYVTDYLNGVYESDSHSIYAYNRYISPVITQSLFINPEIESFRIYKTKQRVLPITDRFLDMSSLDPRGQEAARTLKPGQGIWMLTDPGAAAPSLMFYQNIYNSDFTEKIGLLELRVGSSLIGKLYEAAGGRDNWQAFLLPEQGVPPAEGAPAGIDKATWKLLGSKDARPYFINNKTIVNQLYIEELDVRVVVTGKVDDVFRTIKRKEIILVFTIIALLAVLSFVYYALASTITKRILLLARHMRNLDDDNMKQFISKHDKPNRLDEIGFLTSTYNSMIRRMDELINNVHRSELRNKEAAYKVLQAQIKPHFLYNTLETIRMLAESNNDKEVADISFWFGKLMRYSLSSEGDRTVLAREIETVVFYLNIHKMRLQHRLTYEIDVAMDAEQLDCPRFMLQPLVENSIVHGASAILRPVHIKLQVRETGDEIRISITDNGTGIQEDKLLAIRSRLARGGDNRAAAENGGGVGLFNVSERIKSFFGGSSQLVIDSEQDRGTCLSIIISKEGTGPT